MLGIYFLGTSSGVPTKERNVSGAALLLPEPRAWILIDCGEGTQHQILRSPLSLASLKAIFITHVHGDHCYGLPGLIASAGMSGRTESLVVVGPKEIEIMYLAVKKSTELFTPFDVIFIETEKLGVYKVDSTEVKAITLSHRVPSHAFCFTASTTKKVLRVAKLKEAGITPGPIWGQLQQGNDIKLPNGDVLKASEYSDAKTTQNKVIIAGDNDNPNLLTDAVKNIDLLVHESTYTDELLKKIGTAPQHCSAKIVARFAEDNNIPNLVLTHFSARFQSSNGKSCSLNEIKDEARKNYSGNIFFANDHDEFLFSKEGILKLNEINN